MRHIVATHLDPDHSGGLPDFPEAEVHVLAPELDAALHPSLDDRPRYRGAHWKHGATGSGTRPGRRVVRLRERPDPPRHRRRDPAGPAARAHARPLGDRDRSRRRLAAALRRRLLPPRRARDPPQLPAGPALLPEPQRRRPQAPAGQPGTPARAGRPPRRRDRLRLLPRPARTGARTGEGRRGAAAARVSAAPPEKLWQPSAELVERSRLTEYMRWLEAERGLQLRRLRGALALVGRRPRRLLDLDLGLLRGAGRRRARARPRQPRDARRPLVRRAPASTTPSTSSPARTTARWRSCTPPSCASSSELTWGELRSQVAAVAAGLRALGVERGDRVVAYMPNIPEAIVAFLATASIGAVWSSCSPDFGPASVIDRFAQIEPKVLFAVDGYRYGGKDFDRREMLAELQEAMPSLERTVVLPYLDPEPDLAALRDAIRLGRAARRRRGRRADLRARPLRPPALGPLLLGHDRAAEGDRPGPGRDPARAPEEAPPPRRRPPRRPPLLVHHDRLDDVELPRLRPAHPRPRSSSTTATPATPT